MSDRIKGFVVSLDKDYRDDDAAVILNAIRMVRGVASVEPCLASIDDHINRDRVRRELWDKIFKIWEAEL